MADQAQKKSPLNKRMSWRSALSKIAKSLVRASVESDTAGESVLYGFPGVFCLRISFRDVAVRLIKEANNFRIMESSEKSEVLLSIDILDDAALFDLSSASATWQKVYAEGRVRFAGKMKYAATFLRVAAAGDRVCLDPKKREDLYGE